MSFENSGTRRPPPMLSVGALAKRSGFSVSAIHFYEREGLIRATRNGANHRRYTRAALRVLAIIRAGQRAGIPLAEIRQAIAPALDGLPLNRDQWGRISAAWRDDLDRRIETLSLMRERLAGCIQCGCLSHDQCPIFNENDRAAAWGPGAHRLGAEAEAGRR
ncbi:MerR family transcriptional regulator, redox-sensitive transcriptional activator SoxR [Paracoccus isoporae]|uniref:MerR family transcriptional regulator, redox-sensitive transcriptional activator SoxR n=1 Tax=Paracoccus isoporae TaxID=591205 RepID=A0A1G6UQ23_9RHOB|nr:redox-sensitive transcriptional activator SoxR [Paracoccus isoporae]SDD43344.1 MerR family transcriptional regulator, redox-sensitive transcriptional activator SoxR [Paracoccus isoporae]